MTELESKIVLAEQIDSFRKSLKNKKIVFTNGCFDILHLGHITYLYQARNLGDFLWIGLNSDSSVKKLKGNTRPINTEYDRAILLSSLYFVDAVTIFSEDTPIETISLIQPDIHVKGGDYTKENLPEYPIIQKYGGEVIILPFVDGKSTSKIIDQISKL